MNRIRQVLLGLLFWVAFGPLAIVLILALPVGIVLYGFGNDNIRAWVYRVGKALDQTDNAGYFGGNPKETISSHTGRYIASGKLLPIRYRFVRWLTDLFEHDHCVKTIEEPFVKEDL